MFKKLLVANRGTIAIRIIRACRELGHRHASRSTRPPTRTRCTCAWPTSRYASGRPRPRTATSTSRRSSARRLTYGADAVHPGYGFLSENGDFAEACRKSGLNFVGPKARHIRLMGDKPRARRIMNRAGVPVLPGSEGKGVTEVKDALADAKRLGYPGADQGGGGRRRQGDAGGAGREGTDAAVPAGARRERGRVRLAHDVPGEVSRARASRGVPDSRRRPIATRFISASAIARFSGAIRRCSKSRRARC